MGNYLCKHCLITLDLVLIEEIEVFHVTKNARI
jgi:hypothetical protein